MKTKKIAAMASVGLVASLGLGLSNPAPASAASCNQPDFKPREHVKNCGIALRVFTYVGQYWSAGTLCYRFETKGQACSYKDWYNIGITTACKKYY